MHIEKIFLLYLAPPTTTHEPGVSPSTHTPLPKTTKAPICEEGELVDAWNEEAFIPSSSYEFQNTRKEEGGIIVEFKRKSVTKFTIDLTNNGKRSEQFVYKVR